MMVDDSLMMFRNPNHSQFSRVTRFADRFAGLEVHVEAERSASSAAFRGSCFPWERQG